MSRFRRIVAKPGEMVTFSFEPRKLGRADARDGLAVVGMRVADYLYGCLATSRVPETGGRRERSPSRTSSTPGGAQDDTRKMWGNGKWPRGLHRTAIKGTPLRSTCEIKSLQKAQYRHALQRYAKAGEPAFLTLRGEVAEVAKKAVRSYLRRTVFGGSKVSLRRYSPSKRGRAWQAQNP